MVNAKEQNTQKYENYREQFKRLNKAMNSNFYLEAMFISYAIMEDRTESILRHAGKWEAYLKYRKGREPNIGTKVNYIIKQAEQKKTLLYKYFADNLLGEVLEWKDERNRMIHALMKQTLSTEELEELAIEGKTLARTLANRSTSFSRAIEKNNV